MNDPIADEPTVDEIEALGTEHVEMLSHVLGIRHLADSIGSADVEEFMVELDTACNFLRWRLAAQATAEEEVLYREVARIIGAAGATRTMSRDHLEINRLSEELSDVRTRIVEGRYGAPEERALHRILYGLDAIIRLHVAKEEEIYLPLIKSRLNQAEQYDLAKRMAHATAMALHPSNGIPAT